jgi:hypothetical protein
MTPSANDVTEKLARVRAWLAAVGCGDAKYGDALLAAVVLFLVGIPLAFLSKALTKAPFFATRRERYSESAASEPATTSV